MGLSLIYHHSSRRVAELVSSELQDCSQCSGIPSYTVYCLIVYPHYFMLTTQYTLFSSNTLVRKHQHDPRTITHTYYSNVGEYGYRPDLLDSSAVSRFLGCL